MVKVTFDIEIDRSLPWCVGKGDNADDRSFLDPGRMDGGQGWDKSSDIKGVNNGYWGGGGGRDQQPNSGGESREEENSEKKDFGKS